MKNERAAFERWVNNPHKLDKSHEPGYAGEYTHPWTAGAWAAWQAQRARTLDSVLRGLRSENDSTQLRAIIASVEAMNEA